MLKTDLISEYIQPLSPIPTPLSRSGALTEKVACVLFDIYGTLFISGSGDVGISNKASQNTPQMEILLRKFGIEKSPEAIVGDLFSEIEQYHRVQRNCGIDYPEIEIDKIWMRVLGDSDVNAARAFAVEFELIANPVYPMPNLKEMLLLCRESSVLTGIISNAQFYTPNLFTWFLGAGPAELGFDPDLIFYSYIFGRAKPSPFMFDLAAERLTNRRVAPDSVLYVGNDMRNDICPAQKTGFKTALFAGDARSLRLREGDPSCGYLSADLVITDLLQVTEFI